MSRKEGKVVTGEHFKLDVMGQASSLVEGSISSLKFYGFSRS